jgi:hypothetical protein
LHERVDRFGAVATFRDSAVDCTQILARGLDVAEFLERLRARPIARHSLLDQLFDARIEVEAQLGVDVPVHAHADSGVAVMTRPTAAT